jgi:hypothetical protein
VLIIITTFGICILTLSETSPQTHSIKRASYFKEIAMPLITPVRGLAKEASRSMRVPYPTTIQLPRLIKISATRDPTP